MKLLKLSPRYSYLRAVLQLSSYIMYMWLLVWRYTVRIRWKKYRQPRSVFEFHGFPVNSDSNHHHKRGFLRRVFFVEKHFSRFKISFFILLANPQLLIIAFPLSKDRRTNRNTVCFEIQNFIACHEEFHCMKFRPF